MGVIQSNLLLKAGLTKARVGCLRLYPLISQKNLETTQFPQATTVHVVKQFFQYILTEPLLFQHTLVASSSHYAILKNLASSCRWPPPK